MRSYFACCALAFVVAVLLTPAVMAMALRVGAVSHPGSRHINVSPVARLGGVALYVALFAPFVALVLVDTSVARILRPQLARGIGLLVGGGFIAMVGAIDDVRGLRAFHKLIAQVIVAGLAYAVGFRIDGITLPLFGPVYMGWFGLPATIVWIVGIINAVNLIDGLDGLAAGVVLFAGTTNFIIALLSGSIFIALSMACLIGAVVGFLVHNFNPARIYMGDSGSYLLGFVLSTTVLVGELAQKTSTAVSLVVPCVALGVPIFDTLFTMARRFLERRPMFVADRGHLHHRLLDMGLTHRGAVLVLYGVSIVFCATAIAFSLGRAWQIGLALLAASVIFFSLVRFAGYFEYVKAHIERHGQLRDPLTEGLKELLVALPVHLARAQSESELAISVVQTAIGVGDLFERLEIRRAESGETVFSWGADRSTASREGGVTVRIPIGLESRYRTYVLLGIRKHFGIPSASCQVLMEVLAAQLDSHFVRTGSDWGSDRGIGSPPTVPRVAFDAKTVL